MRISISVVAADANVSTDFIPLEVFPDMTLNDVKGFVEAEIGFAPSTQSYIFNNEIVTNTSRSLTELGVSEGDVLQLAIRTQRQPAQQQRPATERPTQQQSQQPDNLDYETTRLTVLGNQARLAELQSKDPELASAVHDSARWAQLFEARQRGMAAAMREKQEMLARLNNDPFNEEAQRKIEEMIRQERVMENMQKAYEENPESFGHVTMLYIDVTVNNEPIKAFVDSGAQTTIMSPSAAERCGIMRLIDTRFSGIARGVGTAKILGRVHSAEIQIGQYALASSFTVMEGKDVDLLLGLDMLKRHQMSIDLKENCLRISSDRIPFLPENEIPKNFEEKLENEPKVQGPGGTTIGAETGTVAAGPSTSSSTTAAKAPPATQTTTSTSAAGPSRITIHPTGSAGNVNTRQTAPPRPAQAAAPGPTATASATQSAFGQPAPVTEQSIAQVMELGFSREEAITALQQAQGNVELAIGLLL